MATDSDRIVTQSESGLPYALLVHHDLLGHARCDDLGPALSYVFETRPSEALPLAGPGDPRWGWKLAELNRLRALEAPLWQVLDEPPSQDGL